MFPAKPAEEAALKIKGAYKPAAAAEVVARSEEYKILSSGKCKPSLPALPAMERAQQLQSNVRVARAKEESMEKKR